MTNRPRRLMRFLPILLLLPLSPAGAQKAPTAKWVVDFDEAQCVASREYGTTESPLTLVLKPSPLGNVMQILLLRAGARREAVQVPARVQVDQAEPVRGFALVYGLNSSLKRIAYVINMPTDTFAPMRGASRVKVSLVDGLDETLALTQMKELTDTIGSCVDDLQKVWNVGTERSARLKRAAVAKVPLHSVFSPDDYPAVALRKDQAGLLGYILLVDENGSVADCTVDQTSGIASLDAQSCYVMKQRAKFEPAVGEDGKPAKSTVQGRIRWKLEG